MINEKHINIKNNDYDWKNYEYVTEKMRQLLLKYNLSLPDSPNKLKALSILKK